MRKKKLLIAAFFGLIVVAAGVLISSAIKYNEAVQFEKNGDMVSAYLLYSDIPRYKNSFSKMTECKRYYYKQILRELKIGDKVKFGSFEQSILPKISNKEIEWQVLDKNEDKILLISDKLLECRQFNESQKNVSWETCSLRAWLNGEFFNNAFDATERALIVATDIIPDANPKYTTVQGNATVDKVFLLSAKEVADYFKTDEAMITKPTSLAKYHSKNFYIPTGGGWWWWLRTSGEEASRAVIVSSFGGIYLRGNTVENKNGCVRPAIWVQM